MSTRTDPRIAFDKPTGTLSVGLGHMRVHGRVDDIEAFAALLMKVARDQKRGEETVFPKPFIDDLVAAGI